MDNRKKIEEFLKLMAAAADSGEKINMDNVYSNLMFLDMNGNLDNISHNFEIWENYFEGKRNIFCFVQRGWEYFCQFINARRDANLDKCRIKLYVSLDKKHITKGAIRIFEFLAKENIPHDSKIGSYVRIDDVVIRVNGKEDADKVINFINNDEYLKRGFMSSNPFAITDGHVSMAWDDRPSYNTVVSSLISQYINWEKDNSNLNNVSYERFYNYVNSVSNSIFYNQCNKERYIEALLKDRGLRAGDQNCSFDKILINYYYVSKLLLLSLLPYKNKGDLYSFVEQINNRKMQFGVNNDSLSFNKQIVDGFSKKRQLLKIAFDNMVEYYGYEKAKCYFLGFVSSGNYDFITRYKNTRNLLFQNGINREIANNIIFCWKREGLDNAIQTTCSKYGFEHANGALDALMRNRNFSNFTNDYNCRIELIKRFGEGDVALVMHEALGREGYDTSKLNYDTLRELYMKKFVQKGRKIS